MIKNNRQLEYAKKMLRMLEADLAVIRKKYSNNKNKLEFLSKGHIEHIAQLKDEIAEYQRMRTDPLPRVVRAQNMEEIRKGIIRLRMARGLTQAELASRLGCKQSDVSRIERKGYQGFTYTFLNRLAKILDVNLELNFVLPDTKPTLTIKNSSLADETIQKASEWSSYTRNNNTYAQTGGLNYA